MAHDAALEGVGAGASFCTTAERLTLTDAILAHGGQGQAARDAFVALDSASKQALLAFLGCI